LFYRNRQQFWRIHMRTSCNVSFWIVNYHYLYTHMHNPQSQKYNFLTKGTESLVIFVHHIKDTDWFTYQIKQKSLYQTNVMQNTILFISLLIGMKRIINLNNNIRVCKITRSFKSLREYRYNKISLTVFLFIDPIL